VVAEGCTLTYSELDEAAARTARRLAALGVGPGGLVATTLPTGLAFAALMHAAPKLGAVLAPLDPRTPARVDAAVLVERPLEGDDADAALRERVDPDAVHTVMHTSGTTGAPRPVELTYRNHAASARATAAFLGAEPDDRWLCPLPLHHVGGLAVPIRAVLGRTTAVLHERFDPGRVRTELESGGITLASLVPTMLSRLLDGGPVTAPWLRALLLGGGPAPKGLLDAGLPVVPTYGMTETASSVALGSPGRPLEGVELRIAEDGEIIVRGPMVAPGALASDGWLHTGDRGRLDAHGRLHVEGRLKELIVTGGENVAPAEVEAALLEHPAVDDAAVVGVPDAEWGEAVTAFVVLAREAEPTELADHCRARLASFKVPKRIERVEELPRSPGGKLLRHSLR
jgi:O-succinylbenzoic acid--CoA ligase